MVSNYKLAQSLRTEIDEKNARLRDLRRESMQLRMEVDRDWNTIYRVEYNGYRGYTGDGQAPQNSRFVQTFPCPLQTCRGFVDSINGLCGICDSVICLQCGVIPENRDAHTCDENMVLNFTAIKRQTRPCPSCKAPTFKIDGCPQMFCTFCKTPWDWHTGAVIRTSTLHNPHYFEWLRSQSEDGSIPRQPGDTGGPERCEQTRVPDGYLLYQRISADRQNHNEGLLVTTVPFGSMVTDLTMFCRRLIHIIGTEMTTLRAEEDNADLRLQYLINSLTEEQFQVALQRREKKRNKDHEIADVFDMVIGVGGDLLWAYIREEKDVSQTHQSIQRIRVYTNNCLNSIGDRYKMSMSYYYV